MIGLLITIIMAIVIGAIGSAIAPGGMPGGILGAMVAGFVGAWLGALVLGSWGPVIGGFSVVPAILGAAIFVLLLTLLSRILNNRPSA
ncbi:GlsB/YeaQ/YmgE family stress response membrane protein [Paenibacillus sp. TAB 01]|uniref:GlsB/YeaQ/YmgE family stress response membrane protein n=1 Tax=Paenibacillus sp. TAB 01 TaxID=3368988 RepID=UPI00375146D0